MFLLNHHYQKLLKTLPALFIGAAGALALNCHRNPDSVWVEKPGLYPEGLELHPGKYRFLVTSLREGTVGMVSDKGEYKVFIKDDWLISAIGIRVDKKRNRILVANSDPGVSLKTSPGTKKKTAGLGVYNLEDGSLIKYIDLHTLYKGAHFANDIAVDDSGNIYVTDSFSPVIYKVDADLNASVFLESPLFTGDGFSLNGITVMGDFLIVAKMNDGVLYKIPLNDPKNFAAIKTDVPFKGADGLLAGPEHSLYVIVNGGVKKVFKLTSEDGFRTAKTAGFDDYNWRYNTTAVMRCGDVYVLNAELDSLFGGKEPVQKFEIRKVALKTKVSGE